jgi:hypothetical protein
LNALHKLSILTGVDRKTLFIELKQFAEQFQSFSVTGDLSTERIMIGTF